jgi:hypothetical protein
LLDDRAVVNDEREWIENGVNSRAKPVSDGPLAIEYHDHHAHYPWGDDEEKIPGA